MLRVMIAVQIVLTEATEITRLSALSQGTTSVMPKRFVFYWLQPLQTGRRAEVRFLNEFTTSKTCNTSTSLCSVLSVSLW